MWKVLRTTLPLLCALSVCSLAGDSAIDQLAKALKKIAAPKKSGADKDTPGTARRPQPRKPKPRKHPGVAEAALTMEERIKELDELWQQMDKLGKKQRRKVRAQVYETILLTISEIVRGGIHTIRSAVHAFAPSFALANAPLEQLADCVYLLGYVTAKTREKGYLEALRKFYWVSTCLLKNEDGRIAFIDPKSNEKSCLKLDCIKGKKCVAVFFRYGLVVLEPFAQVFSEGVDVGKQHIKGMLEITAMVVAPMAGTGGDKLVQDFKHVGMTVMLLMKIMRILQGQMVESIQAETAS
ncbi:MAG: hypothetical protein M1549_00395 [Candidatus Dependentiae bacterium]|jgi:hypothetical protein|nr:hypothetical protein [Candidatus Dependentiae bacterium]